MNKKEYASKLKELDLEKFPIFETDKWPYEEIEHKRWSHFVGTSTVFWKQKAEGYNWVIQLLMSNGIRKIDFVRDGSLSLNEIPDEVAIDSINALKGFYVKTPWWKWGVGIVGLIILLKILKKEK